MTDYTSDRLKVGITGCARCGHDHAELWFCPFTCPLPEATHWSICPRTEEPILLRVHGDALENG
jgi:hypothetical protein